MDLAHSDTYSGYNGPIRLREHLDWKPYHFKFTPNEEYRYILLEAYHNEDPVTYQGNILLDRLRKIRVCDRT